MSHLPIAPNRRLFRQPNVERWMHVSSHWAAIIVVLGVTVLSGWQIVEHHRKPECSRYDARRDVGIMIVNGKERLCRRR